MNSIDKNQPEKNLENLAGPNAIKKIQELAKDEICFFCTTNLFSNADGTRPMSVLQVDDLGNLWFMSSNDSHKNAEIQTDPHVKLYFKGSAHSDFLYLEGNATITYDEAKIKELWSPLVKTWFTEGIDDPRISVIKVEPTSGYYWDTKHGQAVAGIKMVIGAVIGKTLDDSISGKLDV